MDEKTLKILLIEDNPDDAWLLKNLLQKSKIRQFDLECADKLSSGLEHLAKGGIDVILLDLSLPDSSGLDSFFKINKQFPHIPVVVLTGLDDNTIAMKAVREGAQDYLIKGHVEGDLLVRILLYSIERKQAEQERRRLQDELTQKEKMAAIGEMMESIAHSMKNIFTTLNNSLFLVETSLKEKDWNLMENSWEILRNSSLRLYLLLMNMLDYSKKRKPVFEEINLNSLFEEVIEMLKPAAKQKTIEFEYTIEPGAEVVFSDSQGLHQNLMNLGSNAIDAISTSGKIHFNSCKRNRKDFDMLEQIPFPRSDLPSEKIGVIEVSDTGEGIPQGVMNNIFEPFFSTKGSKGTGLGLSSVKQIMEEQGGRIFVESVEGKGTTFRLVFSDSQNSPISSSLL